jgi:hypothetical protein
MKYRSGFVANSSSSFLIATKGNFFHLKNEVRTEEELQDLFSLRYGTGWQDDPESKKSFDRCKAMLDDGKTLSFITIWDNEFEADEIFGPKTEVIDID